MKSIFKIIYPHSQLLDTPLIRNGILNQLIINFSLDQFIPNEIFYVIFIIIYFQMSEEIESHIARKFEIISKLGKGAYGIVWKAIDKKLK